MATQLSQHFTLEEMTFSSTAVRLGIDNTPSPEIVANLTTVCATLERVRTLLGHPMTIDSGYRSPALNAAVGGVSNSAHLSGYAADFICPPFGTPLDIVKFLVQNIFYAMSMQTVSAPRGIRWDQLIQEGTWVHISVAPTMRQQVLTAHFVDGKATYQEGIANS